MKFESARTLLNSPCCLLLSAFLLPFGLSIWQLKTSDNGLLLVNAYSLSDAALFHYSAWFISVFEQPNYVADLISLSPYQSLLTWALTVFKDSNQTPFVLNAILSGLTCTLISSISLTHFDKASAWASVFLYSFCTPILFFTGTTLKTGLVLCLFALSIYWLLLYQKRPSAFTLIAFIAVILTASIDRIHVLVALMVLIGLIIHKLLGSANKRQTLIHLFLLIGMIGVTKLASVTTYGAEPKYVSSVGLNLYIGHTKPDNFFLKVPGIRNHIIGHRIDSQKVAEKELERPLSKAEVSKFWVDKTLDYIIQNPQKYVRHQLQKLHHIFANSASSVVGERPHLWHHKQYPLSITFIGFAALIGLAFIGVASLIKQKNLRPPHLILLILAGLYLASLMASVVLERYRLPALIPLICLAAYGLSRLKDTLLHSRYSLFIGLTIFISSHLLAKTAPAGHIKNQQRLFATEQKARSQNVIEHYTARATLETHFTLANCKRLIKSNKYMKYHFDRLQIKSHCNRLN